MEEHTRYKLTIQLNDGRTDSFVALLSSSARCSTLEFNFSVSLLELVHSTPPNFRWFVKCVTTENFLLLVIPIRVLSVLFLLILAALHFHSVVVLSFNCFLLGLTL
jgi:hypothetical protein